MILVPVIWLKQGACVNVCTESESSKLFLDPIRLARLWRIQNAKALQLEISGAEASQADIKTVKEICASLDIPIMLALPRHLESYAQELIELGVTRIVIDRDVSDQSLVSNLQALVGLRRLALRFTIDEQDLDQSKFAIKRALTTTKSSRFILRMPTGTSQHIEPFMDFLKEGGCRAQLSLQIDIKDYKDLVRVQEMKKFRVDSLILPKSIYSNILPCQKSWCWNQPDEVDISQVSTAALRKDC